MTYAMLRTKAVKIAVDAAINERKKWVEKDAIEKGGVFDGNFESKEINRLWLIGSLAGSADFYDEQRMAVSPEDHDLFSIFYE